MAGSVQVFRRDELVRRAIRTGEVAGYDGLRDLGLVFDDRFGILLQPVGRVPLVRELVSIHTGRGSTIATREPRIASILDGSDFNR